MDHDEMRPEIDPRFSEPGAAPTSWAEAEEVLRRSEVWWISTLRADRRPHTTPLLTVWHQDALHFCTGTTEQKHRNLDGNPACTLTTGNSAFAEGLDLVVEGTAVAVTDAARLEVLAAGWATKYGDDWRFEVRDGAFFSEAGGTATVFAVRPDKLLAFRKGRFAQTRYRP